MPKNKFIEKKIFFTKTKFTEAKVSFDRHLSPDLETYKLWVTKPDLGSS